MKKSLILILAMTFSAHAFAVDEKGFDSKNGNSILCKLIGLGCIQKATNESSDVPTGNANVRAPWESHGPNNRLRPHGDDQGTPPDNDFGHS